MPITTPKVPEGLPELMRGLAKSVIKENPDNIYVHAAEYFEKLIRERDGDLDRGYRNFSAYKVYADYKQKCRGRGECLSAGSGGDFPSSAGAMAVRGGKMASDGDDDSGGSASAARGRRKKRVRKQGSKDSNRSLEKQDSVGSTTEGADEKKPSSANGSVQGDLGAIKEDSPDIEQAMVKVEVHLEGISPKKGSINKSVSVDSAAAASVVGSLLQNAVGEADEADKETGEAIETQVEADLAEELGHPINCEDVDSYPPDDEDVNGEEYGSAPSTAEVGGEVLGEADVLVNDAPPLEVIDNLQKNSDEVDLSVDDKAEKNEEPVTNGSVGVKSESPAKASLEKEQSGEVQSDGIDTVDEPVPVVEEVEESVPKLPDVPAEEPSAELVETDDGAEAAQVEPIVEEPNDEEEPVGDTQEDAVDDANLIKISEESSVDKLEETSMADEATTGEPVEDGAAEKEAPSDRIDSPEEDSPKETNQEGSESSPIVESESKDNESEAAVTSPKQSRSVEGDANAPSNENEEKNSSKEDDQVIASNQESLEKSGEGVAEGSLPPAMEPAVEESQNEQIENKDSNNESQSLEKDPLDENPETVSGNESGVPIDDPSENLESNENLPNKEEDSTVDNPRTETLESNGKPDEDSPIKSNSVKETDAQSAAEGSPDSTEQPSSEAAVQPEDDAQKKSEEEEQPNDSPKASKEPSLDKPESETNAGLDEPKSSGSPIASKEPSLDEAEDEKNESLEEPKSSGSPKASKEPSLDQLQSELNADVDQPKSSASAEGSKEPSLDEPEPEMNADADQPKSNDSAKASKEPSLDEPEAEVTADLDQPKSSGSAKSSKEPSLDDKADPEKDASLDEPKSNGSAKMSHSEKDASADEPKSNGSAKVSKEPSLEQVEQSAADGSAQGSKAPSLDKSESELNQSMDRSNADQSKESSAKESAGESGSVEDVTGRDGGGSPADGGEVSIGSRMGDDGEEVEGEGDLKEDALVEQPSAPPLEETAENDEEEKLVVENDLPKEDGSMEPEVKQDSEEVDDSKEEVVEEPCIQRQVSPSASKIQSKQPSGELEDIKKVDLASFNKDSAEALFYTLKKSELENQESHVTKPEEAVVEKDEEENDDDADVVVTKEPPAPVSSQSTKRSFTDDFFENSPITEEVSNGTAGGDGVVADKDDNQVFNPMLAASVRNKQLQDQLHSRYSQDDMSKLERSPRKAPMHRSMTDRVDLSRQDTNFVDLRKYDPDYVEEEDQFDGYYIGNIRHKILASSVSVADSDYYDQDQVEGSIDDNNVQTALETIASTDTESTLPSQTTIQANKGFLKRGSQNTSTNIPYSSFGNNAINQSLDDFIEREEQMKEAAEAQAASTIQRSYRRFRTNRKKLLRDYHSTMQTFAEDQSTESMEDHSSSVIQIKLDRKPQEDSDNSFEDARSENRRRPMYSLNIDEYDTAARRMTLTRGVAMQRNSTPEEDSGKSGNASSGEKKSASDPASTLTITEGSPRTSSDLSSEEKKSSTSSDEKENKDNSSSKSSGGAVAAVTATNAQNDGRKSASLDAQKLFIARQRTMPVQIETTVMRAQPKHLRKRIKSAGMIRK